MREFPPRWVLVLLLPFVLLAKLWRVIRRRILIARIILLGLRGLLLDYRIEWNEQRAARLQRRLDRLTDRGYELERRLAKL